MATLGHLADHGSQGGSGGIATDSDPVTIETKRFCVLENPFGRVVAIFQSRGKRVLGRQAIINRENPTEAFVGEQPAQPFMRLDAAENPGAPMEID